MIWNLGIDIGGTNFALGAVDEKGKVLKTWHQEVGNARDPKAVSDIIATGAKKLITKLSS